MGKYEDINLPEKESNYDSEIYYDMFGSAPFEGVLIVFSEENIKQEYKYSNNEFERFIKNCYCAAHGIYQ